jgi:hypothetical protein
VRQLFCAFFVDVFCRGEGLLLIAYLKAAGLRVLGGVEG